MAQKNKERVNNLAEAMEECHLSSATNETNVSTVIFGDSDSTLPLQWPKVKLTVPRIFLHKPVDFKQHEQELLSMGIKFNEPHQRTNYTKIKCCTFNDHKALMQYFENNQLPCHTFGHPNTLKLKIVIRGFPRDIDVDVIKKELEIASIPIIKVHKMHTHKNYTKDASFVLAVLPHDEEGRKFFKITKILGYDVKLEPPKNKLRQCHRCQMWGHSQRYCHGQVKCVKCGGEHWSKECKRDASIEPPKCANCGGDHTANYRKCPNCLNSIEHMFSVTRNIINAAESVTVDNCDLLHNDASDNSDVDFEI